MSFFKTTAQKKGNTNANQQSFPSAYANTPKSTMLPIAQKSFPFDIQLGKCKWNTLKHASQAKFAWFHYSKNKRHFPQHRQSIPVISGIIGSPTNEKTFMKNIHENASFQRSVIDNQADLIDWNRPIETGQQRARAVWNYNRFNGNSKCDFTKK